MPAEAEAIVSANETGRGRNSGVQIEDESHIQLFNQIFNQNYTFGPSRHVCFEDRD